VAKIEKEALTKQSTMLIESASGSLDRKRSPDVGKQSQISLDVAGVGLNKSSIINLNTSSNDKLKPSMFLTSNMIFDNQFKQSILPKKPFKAKAPMRSYSIVKHIEPKTQVKNQMDLENRND
jgi:hypothetical protein